MQVCVNTRTRKYMYMYAHSSDKFELNHDSSPDKSIFKRYLKLLTPLVLKEDNRFFINNYVLFTIVTQQIQIFNCNNY